MNDDRPARIARLQAWATAAGARFDALAFQLDRDGDCTARARRAIAADEGIIVIPRRLMLLDRAPDAMAAWLPLEARRADSPWRPFLDVLPAELSDHPIFRSGDDLDALAGTAAQALAVATHRHVAAAHAALPDDLRAQLSPAELAWGYAMVQSRGFNAPYTIEHRVCFIPIVDLMNHGPGDTTWRYDGAAAAYEVTAVRAFDAGDEVGFDYGDYGNAHLLAGYGFALAHNPHDEAALIFADAGSVVVSARVDDRFRHALALAGGTGEMAAAARRGIERLDQHAGTGSTSWHRACALVRSGERAVLEQIIALTQEAGALDAVCDSARAGT